MRQRRLLDQEMMVVGARTTLISGMTEIQANTMTEIQETTMIGTQVTSMTEVGISRISGITGIQTIMTTGMTGVRITMIPGVLGLTGIKDILIEIQDQTDHGMVGPTLSHLGKQLQPSGLEIQDKIGQMTHSGGMHRAHLYPPRYPGQ